MISLVTSLSVTTVHMVMETCNYKSDSFSYCGDFSIGWVSEFLLLMWVGLFLTILGCDIAPLGEQFMIFKRPVLPPVVWFKLTRPTVQCYVPEDESMITPQ